MEYKNMYPDLFDDTDIDKWKTRNIRKEFLSYEWDMMVQEVAPDVFEFPFLNTNFCDNLVSQFSQNFICFAIIFFCHKSIF